MANPGECKVCFTSFIAKGDHRPRTFPCGHTFCTACITSLLGKGGGHLTCPSCRVQHTALGATRFPINYGMEALIQQMRSLVEQQGTAEGVEGGQQEGEEESSDTLGSEMEVLKGRVISLLLECSTIKCQLMLNQNQLMKPQAQHMSVLTRLCDMVGDNKVAVTQLMEAQRRCHGLVDEGQSIMGHFEAIVEQLEAVSSVRDRRHAINLANVSVQEMRRWKKNCEETTAADDALTGSVQVLEATQETLKEMAAKGVADTDAATSTDVSSIRLSAILQRAQHSLQQLPLHHTTLTTEDLHLMRPELRRMLEAGQVYGMSLGTSGNPHSSKITLENGLLHLYHLWDQRPPHRAHTVQVSGYLTAHTHSSLLAFLDLGWGGEARGRVYIRLHLNTPLARQFLLLCCGRQGYTYAGTSLLKVCGLHQPGEFIMGGDYGSDDGTSGAPLLPDLHGEYKKTGAAGSVWGRWEVEDPRAAQFAITTRECRGAIPRVFGSVEEGMAVVRVAVEALKRGRVSVEECGVVLSL